MYAHYGWNLETAFLMHCMFPVLAGVPGLPPLNVPNICPNQLKMRSAFCENHSEIALEQKYPTNIKGFFQFCGVAQKPGIQKIIIMIHAEMQSQSTKTTTDSTLQQDSEECYSPTINATTIDDSVMSHVVDALSNVEHTSSPSDAVLVSQGTS